MPGREAKDGLERDMAVVAPVVAEGELLEIGVDVLPAKPVIGAEAPSFQKREETVYPWKRDIPGHRADHSRVVAIIVKAAI